jgi:mannose-1-phosphate guanylyltransferase
MVVTGAAHVDSVRRQLPGLRPGDLIAEPSPRDSMAAFGLAAAVAVRRDPQMVVGSFAADHVIGGDQVFAAAVAEAVAVARAGYVATVGIAPTHPATGFGYIRAGGPLGVPGAPSALNVVEFVEKPDAQTAAGYLADGGFSWNAGMFIVAAQTLLDRLGEQLPALRDGLVAIAAAVDEGTGEAAFREIWPGLTKIAIDHAIAEPVAALGGVAVVPGRFDWDDVGDWQSLGGLLTPGADGPAVLGADERVVASASTGVVVPASGRLVAVIGIDDVVVVDTPDALLVTPKDHAQQVKSVVDRLTSSGRSELT